MRTRRYGTRSGAVLVPLLVATALSGSAAERPPIEAAVERRIRDDALVAITDLRVRSERGAVLLTGRAADLRSRDRAEYLAALTRGVRHIENRLLVMPSGLTDEQIAGMVEGRLRAEPGLDRGTIRTVVENGKVLLAGLVARWQQRELAGRVARAVRGVLAVANVVRVVAIRRPDPVVGQEIARRLRADPRTDETDLQIEVSDGRVRLLGPVGSIAERSAVASNAWVPGVEAVRAGGLQVRPGDQTRAQGGRRPTDHQLLEAARQAIALDPRLAGTELEHAVRGGVVFVSGTVPSLGAARTVKSTLRLIEGVRDAVGELEVSESRPEIAIAQELTLAFNADPLLSGFALPFSVSGGVVRLEGTVGGPAARALAEELAANIRGVRAVENEIEMTRDPARLYTDQWQYHRVKENLRWNALCDADLIEVRVQRGLVVLRSPAPAEAALAARALVRSGIAAVEVSR